MLVLKSFALMIFFACGAIAQITKGSITDTQHQDKPPNNSLLFLCLLKNTAKDVFEPKGESPDINSNINCQNLIAQLRQQPSTNDATNAVLLPGPALLPLTPINQDGIDSQFVENAPPLTTDHKAPNTGDTSLFAPNAPGISTDTKNGGGGDSTFISKTPPLTDTHDTPVSDSANPKPNPKNGPKSDKNEANDSHKSDNN